jgi:hypothetical protein
MSTNLNNEETNVIDYLADVKELEEAGVSDAVIAQHLSVRTMQAMPCSDARVILQEAGAVVEDPVAGTRAGSLIDHYSGLPQGEAKSLLGWFISHVFGSGETVSTDSYPRSLQWASVTAGMDANLQVVAQSLLDSAGGRAEATEGDIIEAREEYEAQQAEREAEAEYLAKQNAAKRNYDELYNQHIAPLYSAKDMTDASWIAALQAMSSNWSV